MHSDLDGKDPFYIEFDPDSDTQFNYRAFVNNVFELTKELDLIVGAQAEHNHFTGFEFQPTGRLSWHPDEDFGMWAAVTKSARTPSLEEVSLSDTSFEIGDPDFEAENAISYELGLRKLFGTTAALDVATFYNDFNDLHSVDPSGQITNDGDGDSYGVEVALDLKPCEPWSLRSAYTFFGGDYEDQEFNEDLDTDDYHPKHQFNLRSYIDLGEDWEFDSGLYVVEGLGSDYDEADRWRVDLRLGWQATEDLALAIGAQQINESTQSEFDEFDNLRRQFFVTLKFER